MNGSDARCEDPFDPMKFYDSTNGLSGKKLNCKIIIFISFYVSTLFLVFTIPYSFILGVSDLSDIYKKECYAGMYNKDSRNYGFYPATRCLKIKGQFGNKHIWYYIYSCVH